MLSHLNNELFALVVYLNGIEQIRQAVLFKTDIDYRTNYLDYLAYVFAFHLFTTFQKGI
jgi:hypothetical protein